MSNALIILTIWAAVMTVLALWFGYRIICLETKVDWLTAAMDKVKRNNVFSERF